MIEVNGQSYPLEYLFEAEYKDGSKYIQKADDVSLQDETKNAFYDIFYSPIKPLEELMTFSLIGEKNKYSVSLLDGHFEVNGIPFHSYENHLNEYRLIFYKTHRHHFTPEGDTIGHEMDFIIGWQGNFNEKNIQRIIIIK